MMESLAWGLNLAVLGFFLAVVPMLPKERTWARSAVILAVLALWGRYLVWRITATAPPVLASAAGLFFVFALIVEGLMFFTMAIFFVTISRFADRSVEADRHEKRLRSLSPEQLPTVDVFIATYNEGPEVVERTIIAAMALDYPRFRVWVLDDGRRDWLRDLCTARNVGYIRRSDNRHAKAGNINHALKLTNAGLFAVFDADFTPNRNFLYRTVGFFFADPRVAIVQTPQYFCNPDLFQINLGLADVMKDNEREWYDVILASRDAWDCAFCCGTSALFRRDAIQGVGGIATATITEDIHTSLELLRRGYITRYLNEPLSLGLAPENAKSLLIQRRRWARGHVQLLSLMVTGKIRGLTLRQWLLFIPFHYLLDFPCRLIYALLPLWYLWTGWTHFYVLSTAELLAYQGPTLIAAFFMGRWLIPHARVPLLSSATSFYFSTRIFPTVLQCLIKPFGVPFKVTPKGRVALDEGSDPVAKWVLIVLIVLTVGGIIVGCNSPTQFRSFSGLFIATCWALCNLVLFGLTLLAVSQQPRPRGEERFPIGRPGFLTARGQARSCTVINLSLSGALLAGADDLQVGESLQVSLDGLGPFPGAVVRKVGSGAGVRFDKLPEANRDQLIVYLYTSGFSNQVQEIDPFRVLWQLLKGAILGPTQRARPPETIEALQRQSLCHPSEGATVATAVGRNAADDELQQRNAARQPQSNRKVPEPRPLTAIHGRET
ncbi:MAG: glycosyltransferase [Thermoguttaceae bacterium]